MPLDLTSLVPPSQDLTAILNGLVWSFVLSLALAWSYCRTHRGLSYARSFVHAQVLGALVSATMVAAIGTNIALGLGVLGALAIVRFRTQVRDPRDTMFLFASLAMGMACGAGMVLVAATGAAALLLTIWYMHLLPLSTLAASEGVLRFVAVTAVLPPAAQRLLDAHCRRYQAVSLREAAQGERYEHTYQVRLRQENDRQALLDGLRTLAEVRDAGLVLHHATVEV